MILKAYEVLSDPGKRAKYNSELRGSAASPAEALRGRPAGPRSAQKGGSSKPPSVAGGNDSAWSEQELRSQLLLALYDVRRNNPTNPELSLLVISELLGCPVSGLEFSKWYLKEKGLIRVSESADFSITVSGVDYVEKELISERSKRSVLSLPEARS